MQGSVAGPPAKGLGWSNSGIGGVARVLGYETLDR
jgi:hypothetical protein